MLGALAWPFVEYAVHGVLSHGLRGTWVARMHWSHHVDPRRVRTPASAWVPAAVLLFGLLTCFMRADLAGAALLGLIAGFLRYERIHYRIHFPLAHAPHNQRELLRRQHHLAHHYRNARAYHGVTQRFTDRLFGTLPEHWRADYAWVQARLSVPVEVSKRELQP